MTYPVNHGRVATVDEALALIDGILADQLRSTVTSMILRGVDPDDIDGAVAWHEAETAASRAHIRAQLAAMFHNESEAT